MGYQERERGRRRPQNEEGEQEYNPPARRSRPPLEWKTEKVFQQDRVVLVLQRGQGEDGYSRRSFRLGRESRDNPDKPFPFLDPRDVGQVRELLNSLDAYLTAGQAQQGLED